MSPRKRTTDNQSEETGTIVADSPETDANVNGQSFADRVGSRKSPPAPDPFEFATDSGAGVRLFEGKRDRQMAIKFGEGRYEDKPSQEVIDALKASGYRWRPLDRIWAKQLLPESARSTRIGAQRLFQDISKMIRQEKGLEPSQDLPF